MSATATTAPEELEVIRDPRDPLWEYPQRTIPMSYDEYLAWSGSEHHTEWVNGEAILFMPPKIVHVNLADFLTTLLRIFARRLDLGLVLSSPLEMRILDPFVSREPDVIFVANRHLHRLDELRLNGPADLAIEIISDDSVGRDRGNKFDEYERAGVGEYWITDPRPGRHRFDPWVRGEDEKFRAVLPNDDGRYHSTVLPGFWLRPEWLWEDPLPDETALLDEILGTIRTQG